ncbi:ATP-binding protein [Arenicella xantha]|uniref:histidine kinase n=1 Tax=Arenicella xantha TaxID=644221 RepID=A0A395JMI5_9GAMM|nr:ATP-binding protein [Arenicella xantha]RBP51635.1 histidine kinase/DNA gyrase B/HSP90-like ATPase [Arenicella xantha]
MHAIPTQSRPNLMLASGVLALILVGSILIHLVMLSPGVLRAQAISSVAMQQMSNLTTSPEDISTAQALSAKQSLRQFAEALVNGGELDGVDGLSLSISAVPDEGLAAMSKQLLQALESNDSRPIRETLNQVLVSQQQAIQQLEFGRTITWLATIGLLIALGVWLVSSIRQRLRRTEALLAGSLSQSKTILGSTKDGLFIIKPNFQVGSVQSTSTAELFGISTPIVGDFFEFLQQRVSSDDLLEIKNYIVGKLNSVQDGGSRVGQSKLRDIAITSENESGYIDTRYLSFEFTGNEANPRAGLLVSVSDVTREVELQQQLQDLDRLNEERFQLLIRSSLSETPEITAFFHATYRNLELINTSLRDRAQQHDDNAQKLQDILSIALEIKADAAQVGISLIETSAHQLELSVLALLEQPVLGSQQVLTLASPLKRIIGELDSLEVLTRKFNAHDPGRRTDLSVVEEGGSAKGAHSFGRALATKLGKKVTVNLVGFDLAMIRPEARDAVEATLNELVENAVAHSIELPDVRHSAGKPMVGSITIRMEPQETDQVRFYVQDDGAGFNFSAIRSAAIAREIVDADVCQKLSKNELVRLIFISGFSTGTGSAGEVGGGLGLEKVKMALSELGGKISVGSADGVTAQFAVSLPKSTLLNSHDQPSLING